MPDDDLKKLPPEERIKKLKELEEKKKKEIEEAHKIIRESENELRERKKWEEKVPIPEFASEDLQGLSAEAKEIVKSSKSIKEKSKFVIEKNEEKDEKDEKTDNVEDIVKKSRRSSELEEMAKDEARKVPEDLIQTQYITQLSQQPAKSLYQELIQISERVEDKGYINREEERRIGYLSSAMEKKMEDIESGNYSFTSSVAKMASTAKDVADKLKDLYRR